MYYNASGEQKNSVTIAFTTVTEIDLLYYYDNIYFFNPRIYVDFSISKTCYDIFTTLLDMERASLKRGCIPRENVFCAETTHFEDVHFASSYAF